METWRTFDIIIGCFCPLSVSLVKICCEIAGLSSIDQHTDQEISPVTKKENQLGCDLPQNEAEVKLHFVFSYSLFSFGKHAQ